jgi:NADH-quinone oxidoreductase subunit M
MENFPFLSFLLVLPLLTSVLLALIPSKNQQTAQIAKTCQIISYGSAALSLLVSTFLFCFAFQADSPALQFTEKHAWFGQISAIYLGVDGLSLSMVFLTNLLLPLIIAASEETATKLKPKLYYSLLFLLTSAVLGVFMVQDLILFFIFWEFELLPMYLLIAIWGGENRLKAAGKFLVYTFAGGACLLAAIIFLFWLAGGSTFVMPELAANLAVMKVSGSLEQAHIFLQAVFILFLIGFCIKLPSIPLHTWLPEAHVEAPTPISMFLAGVLLKMGAYGLLRFSTEFFPEILSEFAPWLGILGAINILGGAIFALVQKDMKKVIAYSSVSHMGFVLLGLASLNEIGFNGAIFQMFSHGLISAGLFMCIGAIYQRTYTRQIAELGGLAIKMPCLFFIFLGLAMANLGLPALSGFVGESLVFYSLFSTALQIPTAQISGALSTIGVIITAAYMLWLVKRIFFGAELSKWANLTDIKHSEKVALLVLLLGSLCLGVYPRFLNDKVEAAALHESSLLKVNLNPQAKPLSNEDS